MSAEDATVKDDLERLRRDGSVVARFSSVAEAAAFFFTNPPTTEIYTLSLHDALPICLLRPAAYERGGAVMATETAVHCLCAREDVEVDEQTSRCLRCGKPAREAFLTPAMRDRNAGAPPRSPSQAYRSTIDVLKQATGAVREAEASVRLDGETHVNTPTHMPDQSAGSEAAPPAPTPSPQAETKQPAAPAPVPADVVVRAAKWALAPVVPTPPEPGRPTREWLQQTRALADGFLTRADLEDVAAADARATAAAHTVEATRLRKRAALFTQLLQAIGTDVAPEPLL